MYLKQRSRVNQNESAYLQLAAALQQYKAAWGVPYESDADAFARFCQNQYRGVLPHGSESNQLAALAQRVARIEAALTEKGLLAKPEPTPREESGSLQEWQKAVVQRLESIERAIAGSSSVGGGTGGRFSALNQPPDGKVSGSLYGRVFTAAQLAKRLGVPRDRLRSEAGRDDMEFYRWCEERDPESRGWIVTGGDSYEARLPDSEMEKIEGMGKKT